MVPSPCQKICVLDPASDLCIGCARSAGEIAAWTSLDDAARQAIVDDLPRRQSTMKAARLAAAKARRGGSLRRNRRSC